MGIFDFIGSIFKPAADLIDNLHTSDEEKMELQNKKLELKKQIQEIQAKVTSEMMNYQSKLDNLQAEAIKAEASSSSWLARNWRPITMLTFVALIVGRWMGWIDTANITKEVESQLFDIIQIGLGGYVVGRSAEKIATTYNMGKKRADDDAVG